MSRNKRIAAIVGGVIALCVVCAICGGIVSAMNGGGSIAADQATQTPAPPTDTPAPTATTNPNNPAAVSAYSTLVQTDGSTMSGDMNAMGNDCGAGDLTTCRADLQTVNDDARQFQTDLNSTPAPPCLSATDKELRKALTLIVSGTQSAMDGIDNNDPSQVDQGTAMFKQATTYLKQATQSVDTATC